MGGRWMRCMGRRCRESGIVLGVGIGDTAD
jgi:hypothetical protein